jgi:hypothetical protein
VEPNTLRIVLAEGEGAEGEGAASLLALLLWRFDGRPAALSLLSCAAGHGVSADLAHQQLIRRYGGRRGSGRRPTGPVTVRYRAGASSPASMVGMSGGVVWFKRAGIGGGGAQPFALREMGRRAALRALPAI